ncbi:hypothetical protein PPSIR1_38149 [Plesiocystis pacifica SIR-1]|uniref:Uncharacterized protein n=1 Tax=Plesiocystis pacifica SIR-1 TaxID=391625 RepID=A6GBQ9_9BACT|nr:hypothetical protein PPSIR1_38149 [Plesiocystis pacifica SIR-1]
MSHVDERGAVLADAVQSVALGRDHVGLGLGDQQVDESLALVVADERSAAL